MSDTATAAPKAKKTKTPKTVTAATPPSASEAPKKDIGAIARENAEKRKSIAQGDVFVFVKTPEKPIAPQANVIVETIKAAGDEGLKRDALVANLKGVLKTRQPEERILTYYQASLIDAGIIKIVNPERDAAAAAKDKPTPKEVETDPAPNESAEETPA